MLQSVHKEENRKTWRQSKASTIFRQFHKLIQIVCQSIQIFCTNNGREYLSNDLTQYLCKHGILHQTSCAYTLQKDGIAERKNRHLLEVVRSIMFAIHVPNFFQDEAILTATYLINRLLPRVSRFYPFECLTWTLSSNLSLNSLQPKFFGWLSLFMFIVPLEANLTLQPLSVCLLENSPTQKGYKCHNPIFRKLLVSCDVSFLEHHLFIPLPIFKGRQLVKTAIGIPLLHFLFSYHSHKQILLTCKTNPFRGRK